MKHDGVDRKQSWYLEEVSVKKYDTKQVWVLPCKHWLSLYEEDCQVKRILKPIPPELAPPERVGNEHIQSYILILPKFCTISCKYLAIHQFILVFISLVYEVDVLTGDLRGAGTDAHVFITIYGDRGNTGRVQLVNRY